MSDTGRTVVITMTEADLARLLSVMRGAADGHEYESNQLYNISDELDNLVSGDFDTNEELTEGDRITLVVRMDGVETPITYEMEE